MAHLSATAYNTLLVTTRDQVVTNEAIDQVLKEKPGLELFRGAVQSKTGESLRASLKTATHASSLSTTDSGDYTSAVSGEIRNAAIFDWSKPYISNYRVSYKELAMNNGKEALEDLIAAQMEATVDGHAIDLDTDLHAATSRVGGVASFHDMISATVTFGGLDVATYPWWKSTVEAYDSDSITIRKAFQQTINKVRVAGGNTPTDCLAGVDIFEAWQDYVDGKSTITVLGAAKANVGFQEISYDGLRIVLDPSLRADTALFVHRPTLIAANLDGNFMRVLEPRPVPETLDYDHPIASILAFGTTSRRSNAKLVWNSAGTLSGS